MNDCKIIDPYGNTFTCKLSGESIDCSRNDLEDFLRKACLIVGWTINEHIDPAYANPKPERLEIYGNREV